MTDLFTVAKKVVKAITRGDSLLCALDRGDSIRVISRGLSLVDDIAEVIINLTKPKEEN